jgi:hypothetical protein
MHVSCQAKLVLKEFIKTFSIHEENYISSYYLISIFNLHELIFNK